MTAFERTDLALAKLIDEARPYLVAMLADECKRSNITVPAPAVAAS